MAAGLWLTLSQELSIQHSVALCLVLPAATMILWELLGGKVYRRPECGLDFRRPAPLPLAIRRSATKLIGIWTSWAAVGALYALLPYYRSDRFDLYFDILLSAAPFLVILSVLYVLFVDLYSRDPYDGNWHFGALVQGRRNEVDISACRDHALGYAIKGFFLAFMFEVFVGRSNYLMSADLSQIFSNRIVFYVFAVEIIYYVDIVFATIGYALTLKIFGAQIRTPNTLLLGWVVALACYPPFSVMGGGELLDYSLGREWEMLIPLDSHLGTAMIVAILALTAVYSWATVAFGVRFSNLTHRGIITHGPYAVTKHPAYLAKNIAWWLVHVPFISTGETRQALGACLSLLIVNGIYYARAKTEEAHLMTDPTYRAYAAYIAECGLLARIRRFG